MTSTAWIWQRPDAGFQRCAMRGIAFRMNAPRVVRHSALVFMLLLSALPVQAQDLPPRDPAAQAGSVKDFPHDIDASRINRIESPLPSSQTVRTHRDLPWEIKVKVLRWIGIILALGALAAGVAAGARVIAQLILGMWFMVTGLYSIASIASQKGTVAFTTTAIGLVALGFLVGHRPEWRSRLRGAESRGDSWIVFGTGGSRYVLQLATVTLACMFADHLSTWAIPVVDFFTSASRFRFGQSEALYATSLSAGVGTGALLAMGVRVWPAITVAAFLLTANPPTFRSMGPGLIMATGHTVGSLAFWWLANRYAGGLASVPRVSSVVRLTACALVSASIVSLFSVATNLAGWEVPGPWPGPPRLLFGQLEIARLTFLRIFLGIIVVAPVITLWSTGAPWRSLLRRRGEFAAALAITSVTAWWVFGNTRVGESHYPIPFLLLPVLLWPAFRLGVRETATASLVLAVLALTGSGLGYGPFVLKNVFESLHLVQLFLAVCALGALAVAAEVGRREVSESEMRVLNEDLERRASKRAQELVRAHTRLRRTRVRHAVAMRRVRANIASDLHDSVGASLSRIAILSDIALRESAASATVTTGALTKIGDNARAVIDEMSDAVWFVDPRMENIQQMVVRLRTVANSLFEPNGTDWDIDVAPELLPLTLTSDQRRHLFLILKEALTNVHRHARATKVRIAISASGSDLRAVIDDNGIGMLPDGGSPGHGNGVANMQKRAREVAGALSTASRPAIDGTRIIIDVPLRYPGP